MNGILENFISFCRQIILGARQIKKLRLSNLRKVFSLMGKKEKIAVLALFCAAFLSLSWSSGNFYMAHTVPAPDYGGIYTEGLLGQPNYINPLLAYEETDLSLVRLVFSGLYKYDSEGQLVPDLAESMPKISEDQKQYSVRLKNNVKWHNDRLFTADDVIFTIQALKDSAYKSPYRSLWSTTSVEKLGDFEVIFTTKDISGPFIHNLTLPILPKYVWGRVEPQNFLLSKANLEAVGTGPYAVKGIKKLASGKVQSITLESYSNYFLGKAKVDTLVLKFYDNDQDMLNAFHSREITGFGFTPFTSSLHLEQEQDNAQIFSLPLPQYQVIFFNLNNSALADLSVRKALSAAIDKQKIIDAIFEGEAVIPASPLLFTSEANSALEANGADAEQAKKILDQAGWTTDASGVRSKKGKELSFTIYTNDVDINSSAAEILAEQWKALGIKINLNILPTKQLTDENIRTRNFDILLFTQKFNADPDPFIFWHSSQAKDPGYNLTGYNSLAADKLITEARTTTDQRIRAEKYREFNQLISEQAPAIFLNQAVYIYAVDKSVKNIGLNTLYEPNQRFFDLPAWYMETKRVWK